jgi:hypothetical protein
MMRRISSLKSPYFYRSVENNAIEYPGAEIFDYFLWPLQQTAMDRARGARVKTAAA